MGRSYARTDRGQRRGTLTRVGIPDEDVAQVRAATDIVALISEHTALNKVGRRWIGLCPFHTEKTPSFSVERRGGLLLLLRLPGVGRCHHLRPRHGPPRLRRRGRLPADRAGITLHEDQDDGRDHRRRPIYSTPWTAPSTWYHERLLSTPDAGPARTTCVPRGYDGEVVRQFRLGWAPDGCDAIGQAAAVPETSSPTRDWLRQPGWSGPRRLSGTGAVPDLRPAGRPVASAVASSRRAGPAVARSARPKYKNSQESPDLFKAPNPLRAQLGQEGDHRPR